VTPQALSLGALALLLLWGVLVGLDLVSVPQVLLSRPLAAGLVAGALSGDVGAGLHAGLVLELFALDVLAVGAVRYPDYGPATVAAVVVAVGRPWSEALGVAAALGLLVAGVGGWSLQWVREANGRALAARAAEVDAGDPAVVRALQLGGLGRDALRSLALTALGIALALAARGLRLDPVTARSLTLVVLGAALAAAAGGALRLAGRGARLRWLAAGLGAGSLLAAVLR
jgi:PTS system mannose-specific IIC component